MPSPLARRRLSGPSGAALRAQQLTDVPKLEACLRGWFQEDVPVGDLSGQFWVPRGFNPLSAQASTGPSRDANMGGVKFTAGQAHYFSFGADTEATVANRWGVVIARCDIAGSPSEYTYVAYSNGLSGGAGYRQPFIYFKGLEAKMGLHFHDDDYRSVEIACETSPATWNFMVWYRRQGMLHAIVNGVRGTPVAFKSASYNALGSASVIGTFPGNVTADTWVDSLIYGQSEISDEVADKLVGLAARRCGRVSALIALGHKYGLTAPRLTEEDFNTRYRHQEGDWQTYRLGSQGNVDVAPPSGSLTDRHQHRGEAEPTHTGFTRVFYEKFDANTLADNITGDLTTPFFAPVEISPGNLLPAGNMPSVRIADTTVYSVAAGEVRLRMYYTGSEWRTGSLGSVNHCGLGRTWAGEQIRRVKYRHETSAAEFPGGIFPDPIWGYNRDYLFWRTRCRIEFDDMEAQGNDNSFMNVTLHVHPPTSPGNFKDTTVRQADDFEKYVGYNFTTSRGFPSNLNWWADTGETFTTTTKIEGGMVYGYQNGRETFRDATHPALMQPLSALVTWGHKNSWSPALDTAHTYDFIIEEIEIWLKSSALELAPSTGFTSRPTLSGTFETGETITCTPNAISTPSSQIVYRWYREDGTPIVGAASSTYVLTADEEGQGIRVHVVNAGIKDQPEAWTADSADVVSGGTLPETTWDPANKGTAIVLANSNRDAENNSASWATVLSTTGRTSGLLYVEFLVNETPANRDFTLFGVCENDQALNNYLGQTGDAYSIRGNGDHFGGGSVFANGSGTRPTMSIVATDVVQMVVDFTGKKVWWGLNDDFGNGDPAAGTNPHVTWTGTPTIFIGYANHSSGNCRVTLRTHSTQFTETVPTGASGWDP
jgi:hypothetical protein